MDDTGYVVVYPPDKPSMGKSAVESCKIPQRWIHDEAAMIRAYSFPLFDQISLSNVVLTLDR